ncbi:GNAT family N-acetyltransferase [Aliivibrio fischeri]|uniref:GNAT family N-acetyltransferase n=1 Tax=Aliivibrio fischeri TaxID=668 RepID=UPI0012DA43C9|nr:GNAT family N-acetyltransferase [Aliivibrio fischeri]MUK70250.1 GNAT family N-acetyltransferase [Aliivibrio fischeri]MUK72086.1 GNAT family N-acetyltransferase [Aliivibrio fischeri]
MEIVLAESTDLTEMNKIIELAKRHWDYSDELMDIWLPDLLLNPENLIERTFWIMKENDEIIGVFSLSSISDGIFELEDFWLLPSVMGKGLGRKMFQFVINYLKSNKAEKLVIVSDPNAEGFYQQMGATRVKLVGSKPEGRMLPVMDLLL